MARSTELDLRAYDSDKIVSGYLDHYDPLFAPYVDRPVTLLELGVRTGGSVALWSDYFPQGRIAGIDLQVPKNFAPRDRVRLFEGNQADTAFLSSVAAACAPEGFDIIIDDASHLGELTKISFWHLFERHLVPGGWYVIEDWGTGYWGDWPDGKRLDLDRYRSHGVMPSSFWMLWTRIAQKLHLYTPLKSPMKHHSIGMVGFVKQLIDEQAAGDVTRGSVGGRPQRRSKFEKMIVTPSIVFIQKSTA